MDCKWTDVLIFDLFRQRTVLIVEVYKSNNVILNLYITNYIHIGIPKEYLTAATMVVRHTPNRRAPYIKARLSLFPILPLFSSALLVVTPPLTNPRAVPFICVLCEFFLFSLRELPKAPSVVRALPLFLSTDDEWTLLPSFLCIFPTIPSFTAAVVCIIVFPLTCSPKRTQ